ncbi:alpha/beta hydrolase [Pedococcus sp.]|jgi:pimeloyl-ACP methyl ester carboxylesterase|uniref:alpha/beta fold hydrolase n=1 Tax=Pedococcus sp. TaxID=2860345 RepID=UPI002E167D24|nr:alpha/beta hydrolase [Pedococcus sp.]
MASVRNDTVSLHVEDSGGPGRPVVLIHGWPLSSASWSDLTPALVDAGYRVVAYDRRGFGQSDQPGEASTYDYDTLTSDLDAVVRELDLRDVTLVGFSMGGGEVARYVGTHGADRVHSVVFAAAIPPCLLKDADHPDGGLDLDTVKQMQQQLRADPEGFLKGFLTNFFSADGDLRVSQDQLREALRLAAQADVHAAAECIGSWVTDFTTDLAKVSVPALVIHGDSDAIVPFEVSGQRTHDAIAGSELRVLAGGPHGINTSHAAEFNAAVIDFLQR